MHPKCSEGLSYAPLEKNVLCPWGEGEGYKQSGKAIIHQQPLETPSLSVQYRQRRLQAVI